MRFRRRRRCRRRRRSRWHAFAASSASSNPCATVLVVAVGDQDERPPSLDVLRCGVSSTRESRMAVPPCGAMPRDGLAPPSSLSLVGPVIGSKRLENGTTSMRSAGPRYRVSRRRRLAHEVDPPGHALAAVDQQGERRRHLLLAGQVERLRDAVFADPEVRACSFATNRPALSWTDASIRTLGSPRPLRASRAA